MNLIHLSKAANLSKKNDDHFRCSVKQYLNVRPDELVKGLKLGFNLKIRPKISDICYDFCATYAKLREEIMLSTRVSFTIIWIAVFLAIFIVFGKTLGVIELTFSFWLAAILSWVSVCDIRSQRVSNKSVLLLMVSGFVFLVVQSPALIWERLIESLFVLIIAYCFVLLLSAFRSKTNLGMGDIKLIAASSIWLGLTEVYLVVLIASSVGLIAALIMKAFRKLGNGQTFPFAPFIAFSVWCVWLGSFPG